MEAIKLDEKWTIEPDTYSWKLTSSEMVMKDEFIKSGKGVKRTGKQTLQEEIKDWYFPSIKMCLDKYLQEVFKSDKSISEMANRLSGIESKVEQLTGIFKNQ